MKQPDSLLYTLFIKQYEYFVNYNPNILIYYIALNRVFNDWRFGFVTREYNGDTS